MNGNEIWSVIFVLQVKVRSDSPVTPNYFAKALLGKERAYQLHVTIELKVTENCHNFLAGTKRYDT